jgi:hypothetical protein
MPNPQRTFVVSATGRAAASELAFYMSAHPQVYVWNGSGRIRSQYDVWGGPHDKRGWDAVILTRPSDTPPAELLQAFAAIESAGDVHVPIGGERSLDYRLWRATNLRKWPSSVPNTASAQQNRRYR